MDPISQLVVRVDEVLARLRALRVLAPDASLVMGRAEAFDELEELADELVSAVLAVLPRGVPGPTKSLQIERDLATAATRWADAWSAAGPCLFCDELARVMREDRAHFAQVLPFERRASAQRELERAYDAMRENTAATRQSWFAAVAPPAMLAARQIEWLSTGRDRRSPWSAALTLWERGTWPMLMPDGSVLLWVPAVELSGPPSSEWIEQWKTITALRRAPPRARFAEFAVMGLGASTVSDARPAIDLEVLRQGQPLERFEMGAFAQAGRSPGNDFFLRSGMIARAHFTAFSLDDSVQVLVDPRATNGMYSGDKRVEWVELSSPLASSPLQAGEFVLRFVDSGPAHPMRAALHGTAGEPRKSYTEQRSDTETSELSPVGFPLRVASKAFAAHPRSATLAALVSHWAEGPRFSPPASWSDDASVRAWVDPVIRELFLRVHALAPLAPKAPSRIILERSFVRASARVQQAWTAAWSSRSPVHRMRLLFALDQLPRDRCPGSKSLDGAQVKKSQPTLWDPGLETTQTGAVIMLANALERRAPGWRRDVYPFAQRFVGLRSGVVETIARRAIAWEAAGYENAKNPWELFWELWSHGALLWPMPDGEVLVCVPPRGPDGTLAVNPGDDPPPERAERGFVAALLFCTADTIEGSATGPRPDAAALTGRSGWAPSGQIPDAQMVYRDGWLWARDIRWDVAASSVIGADGRLHDDDAPSRKTCRVIAIDNVHWALAPEGSVTRERLLVNSRPVRVRPLADGDLVELEREGKVLFSGRYDCPSQRG